MGEEDGATHWAVDNEYNVLVEVQQERTHR